MLVCSWGSFARAFLLGRLEFFFLSPELFIRITYSYPAKILIRIAHSYPQDTYKNRAFLSPRYL